MRLMHSQDIQTGLCAGPLAVSPEWDGLFVRQSETRWQADTTVGSAIGTVKRTLVPIGTSIELRGDGLYELRVAVFKIAGTSGPAWVGTKDGVEPMGTYTRLPGLAGGCAAGPATLDVWE
jgi:hypothetical protein